MTKRDDRRTLPCYRATRRPAVVEVPAMDFLVIDGQGDPGTSPAYVAAVSALYAVSYAAKFTVRRTEGIDYAVMPLEGLWWADDLAAFARGDRAAWKWTMMIMQPDLVTAGIRGAAVEATRGRHPDLPLSGLRWERVDEGRVAQVLHTGPYSAEAPTTARLHEFVVEQGLALGGHHHEIYLNDPRRTAPENLRTILRQPVQARPHAPSS